jgi:hypothetical protein
MKKVNLIFMLDYDLSIGYKIRQSPSLAPCRFVAII